ncbi:MAG TPA: hypothetical protein VKW78_10705 [Terriglobales bacterium]|nr:hypothetical protein [Terriglobales bacterium]
MKRFALMLALLIFFVSGLSAASKNSAKVVLANAVTVGSTTIPAGEYKVTWTEPGKDSKVTFLQGKKSVAVVPAAVVAEGNSRESVMTTSEGSTKVLNGLRLKDVTVDFRSSPKSGE